MSKHYTATLVVSEVVKPDQKPTPASYDRRIQTPAPADLDRQVAEVAKIVVRADSLDALQNKLAGHVALIEE